MKQLGILILTGFVLTTCNRGRPASENKAVTMPTGPTSASQLAPKGLPDCAVYQFSNAKQQADTLIKYCGKQHVAADEIFFCAFPNSFKGMQALFGFEEHKGAAPLYRHPNGETVISYFANLSTISKEIYYDKYINICVNGVWEADNIKEGFGFADRLTNDTQAACASLSKRTDKEIKSVFRFIFDGPHPKNEKNAAIFKKTLPKLIGQSERLGKLWEDVYSQIIAEENGH